MPTYYHGNNSTKGIASGWFSFEKSYAEGYAAQNSADGVGVVWAVDISDDELIQVTSQDFSTPPSVLRKNWKRYTGTDFNPKYDAATIDLPTFITDRSRVISGGEESSDDWYPRYRELRNRSDMDLPLTPSEQSELDRLQLKVQAEADALGAAGSAADQLNETLGGASVADVLFSPPTPQQSEETHEDPLGLTEDDDKPQVGPSSASPPLPPLPPRPAEYDADYPPPNLPPDLLDPLGHVYDPTDPKMAGSGVWDELPEVDRLGNPVGGGLPPPPQTPQPNQSPLSSGPLPLPVPVPVPTGDGASGGDDPSGGEGGGGKPAQEDPRGPWALEATTQSRLIEIRDAISSTGKGKSATGQDDDQSGSSKKGLTELLRDEAVGFLDVAAGSTVGRNRSGQNLAGYVKRMRGIGLKAAGKLGKLFPKTAKASGKAGRFLGFNPSKPKRPAQPEEDDDNDQSDTGSSAANAVGSVAGALEGAEAGSAAGPYGAAAGAVAGAVGGGGGGASVGGAAAASLGPVGAAAAGVASLAVAAFEAGKATYQFAREQEAEVRRMSQYGAQQAVGIAQLDADRVVRDVKTAEQTGDSSQSLTESISGFEEKLQPIETLLTNIANTVGGRLLDLVSQVLTPVSELAELVNQIYDALPSWLKDGKEKQELPYDAIKKIAEAADKANAPRWPQGPANAPFVGGPERAVR